MSLRINYDPNHPIHKGTMDGAGNVYCWPVDRAGSPHHDEGVSDEQWQNGPYINAEDENAHVHDFVIENGTVHERYPGEMPDDTKLRVIRSIDGVRFDRQRRRANVLDPIHPDLDPRVWDNPGVPEPTLREEHRQWIVETIYRVLDEHGYDNPDQWLSLVFTGSLTTYQYSDESDVDVSLFVDTAALPDWSRAEMIAIMIDNVDGQKLPGTPFPMQCYVVPTEITKEALYQPGLRSGFDVLAGTWIVPPDRFRVHDVEKEYHESWVAAMESADKMELLLKYEPDHAISYWHDIHERRRADMRAGKGDYSLSNIVYKALANRGLFPQISEVSGEYIASRLASMPTFFHAAPRHARESILQHGLDATKGAKMWEQADYPTGNYLYRTYDDAYYQACTHAYPELEELEPIDMDVWRVNGEGLNVKPDPLMPDGAHMTGEPVHPSRLSLVDGWEDTEGVDPDEL